MNPASPKFDITPGEPIPAALAKADRLLTDTLAEVGCMIIKRSTLDDLLADNERLKAHKVSLMRRYAKAKAERDQLLSLIEGGYRRCRTCARLNKQRFLERHKATGTPYNWRTEYARAHVAWAKRHAPHLLEEWLDDY